MCVKVSLYTLFVIILLTNGKAASFWKKNELPHSPMTRELQQLMKREGDYIKYPPILYAVNLISFVNIHLLLEYFYRCSSTLCFSPLTHTYTHNTFLPLHRITHQFFTRSNKLFLHDATKILFVFGCHYHVCTM